MTSENSELYLRIIDQFPNPIWRAGTDTKCNFFNKAWLEFTGNKMEDEVGDGWVKGVHPQDLDACVKTYLDAFNAHEHFEMEYRIKHNDGTYHWILDSGSPFFDDNGVFLGYIGSCYDINNLKIHSEEIQKMNQMMVDRELKMVEMKEQIKELEKRLV